MNLIFKIWGICFSNIKVWFPCCFEICGHILQIIQIKASESRKYTITVFYFILLHIFHFLFWSTTESPVLGAVEVCAD